MGHHSHHSVCSDFENIHYFGWVMELIVFVTVDDVPKLNVSSFNLSKTKDKGADTIHAMSLLFG